MYSFALKVLVEIELFGALTVRQSDVCTKLIPESFQLGEVLSNRLISLVC